MKNQGKDLLGWEKVALFWKQHERKLLLPRAPLNQRLIKLCELNSNSNLNPKLLDFGTGLGEPGLSAAQASSRITVQGVDVSEVMIEIAKVRISTAKVSNFKVCTLDGPLLPFEDSTFQAAISSFALEFSTTLEENLAELSRVLMPGSKLVISTWMNSASRNPFQSLIPTVVRKHVKSQPLSHDPFFRFEDFNQFAKLLQRFNFKLIQSEAFDGSFVYNSIDDFWQMKKAASPAVQKDLDLLSPEQLLTVTNEIEMKLKEAKQQNSTDFHVPYCSWIHQFEKET